METNVSFLGMGLAVYDLVVTAKIGVEYETLYKELPSLPEREGDLKIVENASILQNLIEEMPKSGLFEVDKNNAIRARISPGGGLNALHFISRFAYELGLLPVAGSFALGKKFWEYDSYAKYLIECSEKAGIRMSPCLGIQRYSTPSTIAIERPTKDGNLQRTIIHMPSASDVPKSDDYIEAVEKEKICPMAIAFYYSNIGNSMNANEGKEIGNLFNYFRKKGAITILDTAGSKAQMQRKGIEGLLSANVLDHTSVFGPGAEEAYHLTGQRYNNPKQMAEAFGLYKDTGPGTIVFKNGSHGAILYTGNSKKLDELFSGDCKDKTFYSPAFYAKENKRSVGAGDAALATGVMYLLCKRATNQEFIPDDFLGAMATGGKIFVEGEKLTLKRFSYEIKNARPIYG